MVTRRSISAAFIAAALALLLVGCGGGIPAWKSAEGEDAGPKIVEGGVKFTISEPKAAKVTIAGDFNDWSATSDPLFDREEKGVWTLVIPLAPGSYQYKFIIDGDKWVPDPGNPKQVKDGFGGYNSVVDVPAKEAPK